MTTSRGESQGTPYGRRRSNTAQSIMRNPPFQPLKFGDQQLLNSWVHDPKESPNVILNQSWWPGLVEGDMIWVTSINPEDAGNGFLFVVPKDEGCSKPSLQISIPKNIADTFDLKNNGEVIVTKVDKRCFCADYVEFSFQDQYLGRNEMWRLGEHLAGQCIFADQEISFIGVIAAKVQSIYVDGKKVSAGYMTAKTKAIYLSLSAKVTIFIQVCRELWEFAGDGERYNEKIVHSFLPELFAKWREAGTNHTVTIVLISRVYYDESEVDYAAGPLRRDDEGRMYKDFFKVITDLEVVYDWKPTLVGLKDSFWDFQRDILLTHHYHQATVESTVGPPEQVRLVGRLSYAHDGPILEALNLALNPNETHYVDRSLSLTGTCTIVVTPGTGYYRVSKQLLRLTTTRMLDQGFGLDLVSLAKRPLHQSPIFSFRGQMPRADDKNRNSGRAMDPLWGGDEAPDGAGRKMTTFWWEPFWIAVSFWDKQMDMPFREDRFIARAKMHEIQMLGLLEHDVSSIEVPFLTEETSQLYDPTSQHHFVEDRIPSQSEADMADMEIFASKRETTSKSSFTPRNSFAASGSSTLIPPSYRSSIASEKRSYASHRSSIVSSLITPIEESPRHIIMELPPEGNDDGLMPSVTGLSSSPSRSSISSVRSGRSGLATASVQSPVSNNRRADQSNPRLSKLTTSWLFNPFRSGPSAPQTSSVYASSLETLPSTPTPRQPLKFPVKTQTSATPSASISRSPQPVAIIHNFSGRSGTVKTYDEESSTPVASTIKRNSPMNTPPRDDSTLPRRRSIALTQSLSSIGASLSSSSPSNKTVTNPSRPQSAVSYAQSALARRWQHLFPAPIYKHEIKWKFMVTPGCLPLTVEHFPTIAELDSTYEMFSYDFLIDPNEMRSFLVQPIDVQGTMDERRRAWALVVMRGMVAVRLTQGFQFVLGPGKEAKVDEKIALRRSRSFIGEDDSTTPKPMGAAEVLHSTEDPVYLSMSNEIHRISYTGEVIQVRRFVRRMPLSPTFEYQCLIWPKLGVGYTALSTSFSSRGLENYGWNRLDMLVAGYEQQFNESLRYWRTRFIVIPTTESPMPILGPSGEKLNDEEIRLIGIDKLAEIFSKLRWQPPEERNAQLPPVRFLPTTLGPAFCVADETLIAQLDEIHAAGPLKKKMKSERDIADMPIAAIAKAMREEDGVPIKLYQWHGNRYPDSFTGYDFVSWLVREFRDVSSREQGAEWGTKLLERGLFAHCRGKHGFLDGHYFYHLKGEYAIVSTPKGGWFRAARHVGNDESGVYKGYYPSNVARLQSTGPQKTKKRLILTQSMVIDIDPGRKSDRAEAVVLHHDIIQNPATTFHFELQWIGTTARCIDDTLRQWTRTIERYGLSLVEAYVTEINNVHERNAFQSCFPLRLVIPPPIVPNLDRRVPEGTHATHYFEYALLKRFGFIIDIEAASMYPEQVDVVYSYRRTTFKYSQFVHRSGVAFIQVLGGSQGFLFLTNRLIGPGKVGNAIKSKDQRPAAAAEEIRIKLQQICFDKTALNQFYDEELAALPMVPEDPPPLSI